MVESNLSTRIAPAGAPLALARTATAPIEPPAQHLPLRHRRVRTVLIARSPVRISFGGGGTDLAAYYTRFGGMVVSASINKYIYGIVTKNFDTTFQVISADYRSILKMPTDGSAYENNNLELRLCQVIYEYFDLRMPVNVFIASEVPPGTGLGSSSVTSVTLCNIFSTLSGRSMSKAQLAETAYEIETQRLEAPIGKQDQYASAFGGLNCFEFTEAGVRVTPLKMTAAAIRGLERRLMLFYTGATRQARDILQEQRSASEQRAGRTIEALHQIKALGWQIKDALENGRLDDFGALLDESWQQKKQLASGISNPFIDDAYAQARANGALGGKITGAGGGGFLMLCCPEDRQPGVRQALERLGLQQVRFAFEFEGTRVLLHTALLNSPYDWNQ
jgi:D-glycero-alpha-D-manno-heptose-7-phosphate kinase